MPKWYTTWGSIRRGCGHAHKTLAAAERCLRADQHRCHVVSQLDIDYSDREIRAIVTKDELRGFNSERGPGVRVFA